MLVHFLPTTKPTGATVWGVTFRTLFFRRPESLWSDDPIHVSSQLCFDYFGVRYAPPLDCLLLRCAINSQTLTGSELSEVQNQSTEGLKRGSKNSGNPPVVAAVSLNCVFPPCRSICDLDSTVGQTSIVRASDS